MRTTMEQMDKKIEEAMAASESELDEDEESEQDLDSELGDTLDANAVFGEIGGKDETSPAYRKPGSLGASKTMVRDYSGNNLSSEKSISDPS